MNLLLRNDTRAAEISTPRSFRALLLPQCTAMLRLCVTLARVFLTGAFVAGLVIHFFVKDRIGALAFVYYAAPLPMLALLALMVGLLWRRAKQIRVAQCCFIFTIGALIAWPCENFTRNSNARTSAPGEVKLFFWNAAGNGKTNEIASYIHDFDADLIGIVEAGIRSKQVSTWQNVFLRQHVEKLSGGMAVITKGKLLSKAAGSLGGRGRFNLLEVDIKGERFHVLLVDFDSAPNRSRAPAFEPLLELIRTYAQTNLIVMGDFNTPLDSVFFESFRPYLTHAFEAGGIGFAKTWPVPVPILAIDHLWVSKKIKVVNCELNWSRLSDHRPIVAGIESPICAMRANRLR